MADGATRASRVDEAIDLARYPIDAPEAADFAALVARCRADMAATGACVLDGFLNPEALPGMVAEVAPHLGKAYARLKAHGPYLGGGDDPALPPDHVRNRKRTTSSATLAYDHIPKDSALNAIYLWPPLGAFVAAVLGYPRLHAYADPLSPLNILVYNAGHQTNWHFDVATFVVTLLLQSAEGGGAFEYAPFVRTPDDPNYAAVERIVAGGSDAVRELRQPEGALVLFRGSMTLHRVTPVAGPRPRLVAVLSYAPEPGTLADEHNRRTFYGRVA